MHMQGRLYWWSYVYYLSKYYEFLDTLLLGLKVSLTCLSHACPYLECITFVAYELPCEALCGSLAAGQANVLPARVPPQCRGRYGLPVAGGCPVPPADCPADKHRYSHAHVLVLPHERSEAAASVEEARHNFTDSAVLLQVRYSLANTYTPDQSLILTFVWYLGCPQLRGFSAVLDSACSDKKLLWVQGDALQCSLQFAAIGPVYRFSPQELQGQKEGQLI